MNTIEDTRGFWLVGLRTLDEHNEGGLSSQDNSRLGDMIVVGQK
jgi:hypothetical protein